MILFKVGVSSKQQSGEGVALLMEPLVNRTNEKELKEIYKDQNEITRNDADRTKSSIFKYLQPYKRHVYTLLFGMLIINAIQFALTLSSPLCY